MHVGSCWSAGVPDVHVFTNTWSPGWALCGPAGPGVGSTLFSYIWMACCTRPRSVRYCKPLVSGSIIGSEDRNGLLYNVTDGYSFGHAMNPPEHYRGCSNVVGIRARSHTSFGKILPELTLGSGGYFSRRLSPASGMEMVLYYQMALLLPELFGM